MEEAVELEEEGNDKDAQRNKQSRRRREGRVHRSKSRDATKGRRKSRSRLRISGSDRGVTVKELTKSFNNLQFDPATMESNGKGEIHEAGKRLSIEKYYYDDRKDKNVRA